MLSIYLVSGFMLPRDLTYLFIYIRQCPIRERLAIVFFYNVCNQHKENEKGGKSMQMKKKIISDELNSRYLYIEFVQPYHQLHAGRRQITVMFRLLERERKQTCIWADNMTVPECHGDWNVSKGASSLVMSPVPFDVHSCVCFAYCTAFRPSGL